MLTPDEVEACGARIAEAYTSNSCFEDFPVDTSSLTVSEAAAIQDVAARIVGGDVLGWKVGYANEAKRLEHGEAAPVWGRLFSGAILTGPAELRRAALNNPIVEGEWAVRLGRDLPQRDKPYTPSEIVGAVAALMPAIEFADPRLTRAFSVVELLAINAGAFRVILGPELENWRQVDFNRLDAELVLDDEVRAKAYFDGQRTDPMWSLCHLANTVTGRGGMLRAGQVVSTGVILPLFRLESGRKIEFKVEGIEGIELLITD